MNYLVVVAHPDDEVLGAGATIHKLIAEGHNVAVECCLVYDDILRGSSHSNDLGSPSVKRIGILRRCGLYGYLSAEHGHLSVFEIG